MNRRRTTSAEFAALPMILLSWDVVSFQSLRTLTIPYISGCHTSIGVGVNGYNMLWVQLQAGGGMQSNTDKLCLLIPFTSALNTWQSRNLPTRDTDSLAIGEIVHFQLYRSTRPLLGHSIKCSHYHQTTLHVD